jgi:hypothetical protein
MVNYTETDYINQFNESINDLSNIIEKYKKNSVIEIEVRIGRFESGKFVPGLNSKEFFDKIKNTLNASNCWTKVNNIITEDICQDNIKRITNLNGKKVAKHIYQMKEKVTNIDYSYENTPYDIRINVSKETTVLDKKIKSNEGLTRKKNRLSFIFKDYSIDLTEVTIIDNGIETINYEVEVELINLESNVSNFYRAHQTLLIIRDLINMCESILPESKFVKIQEKHL